MRREDLEKLLGGYAAGTLTEQERRALFEAAVSDQALFDALANEEPLRDTLADLHARAQVLAALGPQPPSLMERLSAWIRRPQAWALTASAAAAVVIGAVVLHTDALRRPEPVKQEVAMVRSPAALRAPEQDAPARQKTAPEPPAKRKIRPTPRNAEPQREMIAAVPRQAEEARAFAPPQGMIAQAPQAAPPAAAPAPPPVLAEEAAKPRVLLSADTGRVRPTARDLFLERNVVSTAGAARSNLAASEQKSAAPMEKRARADTASFRPADLGLRYSLMRRGVDGNYFEVPPDTALNPGEPARLRIESNEPGHLYVLADGSPVFTGPVRARQPVMVEARPGKLSLILSRQPDPGPLDTLVARTQEQLAGAELQVDKPAQLRPRDEAVYVVNASPAPGARVVVEVQLTYR